MINEQQRQLTIKTLEWHHIIDAVLVSSLLTLNVFHTFLVLLLLTLSLSAIRLLFGMKKTYQIIKKRRQFRSV